MAVKRLLVGRCAGWVGSLFLADMLGKKVEVRLGNDVLGSVNFAPKYVH